MGQGASLGRRILSLPFRIVWITKFMNNYSVMFRWFGGDLELRIWYRRRTGRLFDFVFWTRLAIPPCPPGTKPLGLRRD